VNLAEDLGGNLGEAAAGEVARGLQAQLEGLAEKQARGLELIGWKVGLNVEAVQQHFGLSRPVLGHLTTASLIESGATHSLARGLRVGVEPEVAIHLGPGGTIASLGPAIEIVDLDPAQTELEQILAGNVFHRGVVLGDPVEGVDPADLPTITATVKRNSYVAERARFADTGADPAEVLALIAERLAPLGEGTREGQVIIAGSLTAIVFVEPGDQVEVDLGLLGALEVRFA
jgi:2-keto-4-pentenoate hydratase